MLTPPLELGRWAWAVLLVNTVSVRGGSRFARLNWRDVIGWPMNGSERLDRIDEKLDRWRRRLLGRWSERHHRGQDQDATCHRHPGQSLTE